jgi:hypothetical protein
MRLIFNLRKIQRRNFRSPPLRMFNKLVTESLQIISEIRLTKM